MSLTIRIGSPVTNGRKVLSETSPSATPSGPVAGAELAVLL